MCGETEIHLDLCKPYPYCICNITRPDNATFPPSTTPAGTLGDDLSNSTTPAPETSEPIRITTASPSNNSVAITPVPNATVANLTRPSQRKTMDPAEAAALASQVSTAVGAALGLVIAGSSVGLLPPGPGAAAIVGQVQVLSQLGKVGGGRGALGAFSEGFAVFNFELPMSLFPDGNEPDPEGASRRSFRRIGKKSRPEPGQTATEVSTQCQNATMTDKERAECRECGLVDGIPLLDKLSLVAMSLAIVFCIRAFGQLLVTKCMKKDPWVALMFPNWEGPLLLAQWFGMCDSLTLTLGRPCPFWIVLACLIIFLGPILFLLFAAWRISRLIQSGVMAYEDVDKVTWKETREKLSACKTLKEKLGPLQEWYHAKRNKGEWVEDSKESRFWRFLTKDFSQKAWKYCVWLLMRKLLLAVIMSLTLGAVNAGCSIILQVVDVSVICFMNPFTDNAFQLSETFGAMTNLLTMILAAMPALYGSMPEAFSDFALICCALMGTLLAAVMAVVAPIFGLFGTLMGSLISCIGGSVPVEAPNLVAPHTLLAASASIRDSLREMAEDALEEFGQGDGHSGDVAAVGVGAAAVGGAAYYASKARHADPELSGPLLTTLRLAMDFIEVGDEGCEERRIFEAHVIDEIAAAAEVPTARFELLSLSPGSILVKFFILSDTVGNGPPASLVLQCLQEQAQDPNSKLCTGSITCHTESLYASSHETRVLIERAEIETHKTEAAPLTSKEALLNDNKFYKDAQSRIGKTSLEERFVGDGPPDNSVSTMFARPPSRALPPLPPASNFRSVVSGEGEPLHFGKSMQGPASPRAALGKDAPPSPRDVQLQADDGEAEVEETLTRQDEWGISCARRKRLLMAMSQWGKCDLTQVSRLELRAAKLASHKLVSKMLAEWCHQCRLELRAEKSDTLYLDRRWHNRVLTSFIHGWREVVGPAGGLQMTLKTSQYGKVLAFQAAVLTKRNTSILHAAVTKWLFQAKGLGQYSDDGHLRGGGVQLHSNVLGAMDEGGVDAFLPQVQLTSFDKSGTPSPPPYDASLRTFSESPQHAHGVYERRMFSQRSQDGRNSTIREGRADSAGQLREIRPKYYEADDAGPARGHVVRIACTASNGEEQHRNMTSPPISRGLRAAASLREQYSDHEHPAADSLYSTSLQHQGSESGESGTSGSSGRELSLSPPHVNGLVSDLIGAALAGPSTLEQKLEMLGRSPSSLGYIAEKLERRAESQIMGFTPIRGTDSHGQGAINGFHRFSAPHMV